MALASGTRLGVYEILVQIGVGGMGEVYQSKDTRLKRDVALKVLPDSFAHDADRLARFQREAELLATLNHPNIAGIYGLEESNGVRALVLELVDGPTLADRIAKGPIPVDEALPIAKQIADALEAAHEQGVIHRDLKPANIKLRLDGTVKVLDFGLAKLTEVSAASGVALSRSPTITTPAMMTGVGTILGTAAYMSPEQARGKPVDKRADIWAFGCVLYEMLTGRRLFDGETVSDALAAVLTKEPAWDLVPSKARPLVRRCLQKDPRNRARDIGEAMAWADSAPEPSSAPSGRRWIWPGIAAVSAVAAVWLAIASFRVTGPAPGATVRFQLPPPDNVNLSVGLSFAISPDARSLAFRAAGPDGVYRLWVRALDSLEARPLAGTETSRGSLLVWSPDSRQLAFVGEQKVKTVAVSGGPPQTLCEIDIAQLAVGGSWNRNGVIIFGSSAGGLTRASAAGGPCTPLTNRGLGPFKFQHTFPSFLPDGTRFLYLSNSFDGSKQSRDLYVGSLDAPPERQTLKKVVSTNYTSVYVPSADGADGRLLFVRDRTLLAQPFDLQRLELTGDAVPVADQIGELFADAYFSASESALVYRTSASERYQLTWFDRQGRTIGTAGDPVFLEEFTLSRDGTRAAYQDLVLGGLRVLDLGRGTTTVLFGSGMPNVAWSPDGSRLVIGAFGLYQTLASGAKDAEALLKSPDRNTFPLDWSRDGRFLLYRSDNQTTKADVWALPLDGAKTPFPVVQTPADEPDARFSPDGRWIAYTSNESGKYEVYVRPFTPPSAAGASQVPGALPISKGGGNSAPRWRADGQELWYRTTDNKIMAVDVKTTPTFQAGDARVLFQHPAGVIAFDTDGERFLLAVPAGHATQAPFTVVLNWQAALKK